MSKKVSVSITNEYANRYNLPKEFVGKTIVLYGDRLNHISKHAKEFSSEQEYNKIISNISKILKTPDFICKNDKNNSMELIKRMSNNILVAIRISPSKELKMKTL